MKEYTYEELSKIFRKLSKNLKAALFDPETADILENIQKRYNLDEEQIRKISKITGYCLMGLLLPTFLAEEIQKETKIPQKDAQNISVEIIRLILYPVKDDLEKIYTIIEFQPGGEIKKLSKEKVQEKKEENIPKNQEDIYREKIEEEEL